MIQCDEAEYSPNSADSTMTAGTSLTAEAKVERKTSESPLGILIRRLASE